MFNNETKSEPQLGGRELSKRSMKRILLGAPVVIGLSLFSLTCQKSAQSEATSNAVNPTNTSIVTHNSAASQPPAAPRTNLKIGDQAPDFALTDTAGQPIKLSDFRGKKNVVLAFYVLAFTGG
jgi:cytochrome oxidase Cu insertion factor (SCO1/SenC/PrrC family)